MGGAVGQRSGDGLAQPEGAEDEEGHRHQARHHRGGHQHREDVVDEHDEGDGQQAQPGGHQQALALPDQGGLLLLEGTYLAGVVEVVADVAQRLEHDLGTDPGGVVVDQGLLVAEADRHFVDAVDAPERLFDRAGAQRAVQPRDAGPDTGVSFEVARLLVPEGRGAFFGACSGCCGHRDPSNIVLIS